MENSNNNNQIVYDEETLKGIQEYKKSLIDYGIWLGKNDLEDTYSNYDKFLDVYKADNEKIMESIEMFFADADTHNMEIFITDKKEKEKCEIDDGSYIIGLGDSSNFEYEWIENNDNKLVLHINYNDLDDDIDKELNIHVHDFIDYMNLGLKYDKLDVGDYVLDKF